LIHIDANGLQYCAGFEINWEQSGCTQCANVDGQNLVPELEQFLTQEGMVFALGIKGADDTDRFGHGGNESSVIGD
jgi:hypothetical protein